MLAKDNKYLLTAFGRVKSGLKPAVKNQLRTVVKNALRAW